MSIIASLSILRFLTVRPLSFPDAEESVIRLGNIIESNIKGKR